LQVVVGRLRTKYDELKINEQEDFVKKGFDSLPFKQKCGQLAE